MRTINGNLCKGILCIILCLFLPSCASRIKETPSSPHSSGWLEKYRRPPTVVILPFENLTPEKELGDFVRESFYRHFSAKNYHDFELNEVDRILEIHQNTSSKTWKDLTPENLGALFHADLLLYGKVLTYKKYFAGIYSQIALEVAVEIVECKTGEGVWRKTLIDRSHEGGVPLTLIDVVSASLRSGYHLREKETIALADQAIREIVAEIPNPPTIEILPSFIEIQVASFLECSLAEAAVKNLERKGLETRIVTVPLNGHIWHRLILGPYANRGDAEKVKSYLERDTLFKPFLVHRYAEQKPETKIQPPEDRYPSMLRQKRGQQ